jgi:hypothetical protein
MSIVQQRNMPIKREGLVVFSRFQWDSIVCPAAHRDSLSHSQLSFTKRSPWTGYWLAGRGSTPRYWSASLLVLSMGYSSRLSMTSRHPSPSPAHPPSSPHTPPASTIMNALTSDHQSQFHGRSRIGARLKP